MQDKKFKKSAKETEEDKKLSHDIDALNRSYHYHKHVLFEDENGLTHFDSIRISYSRRSVTRIESTLEMLPRKARIIIEAEVINSKKGTKWYREYYTAPSYYRNRKRAYKLFIELINK